MNPPGCPVQEPLERVSAAPLGDPLPSDSATCSSVDVLTSTTTSPANAGNGAERLIKSVERVRDLGEVFTPAATVKAMLDLLPTSMWIPHPSATFFEPACGDGNFLVAILERKLANAAHVHSCGELPAGTTPTSVQFHALEALSSIYAVDISVENIVGDGVGSGRGARTRMLMQFKDWYEATLDRRLTSRSSAWRSAQWIVEHNILVGDMLSAGAKGRSIPRNKLPIMEYKWNPAVGKVTVYGTTLGAIASSVEAETTGVMSLFGSAGPELLWSGKATALHQAPRTENMSPTGPVRNGKGCERK